MKNNFFFKNKFKSIYNKPSKDSEVTSQILYGEKFTILSQKKNWLRIKTKFDNYTGYIKTKDYTKNQEPTHKVFSLKATVINTSNKRKTYLPFGSKISIIQEKPNYIEFEKNNHIWKDSSCNYPIGTVVEIATFKALQLSWKKAKESFEREHVFPFIQSHPEIFKISNVKSRNNYSHIRITVDKKQDLKFVREIYARISNNKNVITINDLNQIVSKEPLLLKINENKDFDKGFKKTLLTKGH